MGEVTYLMVLGSIALIFPILVVATGEYMNQDVEEFSFIDFDAEYSVIANLTCDNIFDENEEYSKTNYEILRDNMFDYFYPENVSWIWKPYIQFGCFSNVNYIEEKIDENLLTPDEVIEYQQSEQDKESKGLFYRMKPNEFFRVLGTFPDSVQLFIYSFYGIFLGYLIWRTFTIGWTKLV